MIHIKKLKKKKELGMNTLDVRVSWNSFLCAFLMLECIPFLKKCFDGLGEI